MTLSLRRAVVPGLIAMCVLFGGAGAGEERPLVVVTTFPLFQIARNVAEGRDGVSLELLLAPEAGCPHDYALTPGEMARLARADTLVVNGLGLEEFLGGALERIGGGADAITVFDASTAVTELLPMEDGSWNPHFFSSPVAEGEIAAGLAGYFAALDPAGAGVYRENAARYGAEMGALAREMKAAAAGFPNKRVVAPHGAFDYLARDIGLEIVGGMPEHGVDISAARLLELAATIRWAGVGAILVEPQYSPRAGEALAEETGAPVVQIDPVATGTDGAPLDYFATAMRKNLGALAGAPGGE